MCQAQAPWETGTPPTASEPPGAWAVPCERWPWRCAPQGAQRKSSRAQGVMIPCCTWLNFRPPDRKGYASAAKFQLERPLRNRRWTQPTQPVSAPSTWDALHLFTKQQSSALCCLRAKEKHLWQTNTACAKLYHQTGRKAICLCNYGPALFCDKHLQTAAQKCNGEALFTASDTGSSMTHLVSQPILLLLAAVASIAIREALACSVLRWQILRRKLVYPCQEFVANIYMRPDIVLPVSWQKHRLHVGRSSDILRLPLGVRHKIASWRGSHS